METIDAKESTTTSPESSSEVEYQNVTDGDGLVSTVAVEKEVEEVKEAAKPDTSEDAEQNTSDKSSKRLDRDERFKQVIAERNADRERAAQLQAELAEMREMVKGKTVKADDFEFDSDTFFEDPKGVLEKYREKIEADIEAKHLTNQVELLEKRTREAQDTAMLRTFETFFEKTPEAKEMWDKGELQKYMKENPGHNAISAYREMTLETAIEKTVREAVEKAEKETRDKVYKEIKAKGLATSQSTTPGKAEPPNKSEYDTKLNGGMKQTLVKLLRARGVA